MHYFQEYFHITPQTRILDVGSTDFNWTLLQIRPKLILLNIAPPKKVNTDDTWLVADGCHLPFPNKAFDIVYSNSVIEHLGNMDTQRLFAAECLRVGCRCYLQTPNKSFFLEPHLLTPFIHWLPLNWRERLVRNFTVWGLITRPSKEAGRKFVRHIRLLGKRDIKELFPNAQIVPEKVLGSTKSFIVIDDG
jgi:hypothetical protein